MALTSNHLGTLDIPGSSDVERLADLICGGKNREAYDLLRHAYPNCLRFDFDRHSRRVRDREPDSTGVSEGPLE